MLRAVERLASLQDERERLCAMAGRLPAGFVDSDRRLALYAYAVKRP